MKTEAMDLLELKRRIEQTKAEKNQIEGVLKKLRQDLEAEFGTDDPKAVQVKLDALKRQADQFRATIQDGIKKLREELGE